MTNKKGNTLIIVTIIVTIAFLLFLTRIAIVDDSKKCYQNVVTVFPNSTIYYKSKYKFVVIRNDSTVWEVECLNLINDINGISYMKQFSKGEILDVKQ